MLSKDIPLRTSRNDDSDDSVRLECRSCGRLALRCVCDKSACQISSSGNSRQSLQGRFVVIVPGSADVSHTRDNGCAVGASATWCVSPRFFFWVDGQEILHYFTGTSALHGDCKACLKIKVTEW